MDIVERAKILMEIEKVYDTPTIKSLIFEVERLREALKNIACINPSATNSSYVMRDVALTALQRKEGE